MTPLFRWQLHLLVMLAVGFLAIYSRLVCPFIDSVSFSHLLTGLLIVFAFQLLLRESLLHWVPAPRDGLSLPRFGFYLSVLSWVLAGLFSMLVHELRYPDFPVGSHLKLMTGYWGLGAGLLAQLEYVLLERHLRHRAGFSLARLPERLSQRLLEGFTLFTLVPALAMTLLVARYVFEDLIQPGVAAEILFISVFFVTVAVTVAWTLGRTLREDTELIVDGLARIAQGRFDLRLQPRRSDELGLVSNGINEMADGLDQRERIREAFGRFVSPQVAEAFIQEYVRDGKALQMGGRRQDLSVLLCDIRDFTPLSEHLPPERLTELLNAYFERMVAVLNRHGGMVDKFIGDAVMAVFGLVEGPRHPACDAVDAALEMQQALAAFNLEHADRWPTLRQGIGIHHGPVVAGYLGTPERLEFTVIGANVNLAARIEAQAKPPRPPLLFSEAVAGALDASLRTEPVGSFELKGVEQPVQLFTVTSHEI